MTIFFESRKEAGEQLARELFKKKFTSALLVLGLPRGGVVVAAEVATTLKAPLDLCIAKKMGAPFNPELALGAVVEGDPPAVYLNDDMIQVLRVENSYLETEKQKQIAEILRQQKVFRNSKPLPSLKEKTVIVVDDGIATGATIRAALMKIKNEKPARLVLAVPVATPEVVDELSKSADEIVCLHSTRDFRAVGQFYRDFRQVTEDDVLQLMKH